MQKLFTQLLGAFRQFLKQRDNLLMLVSCGDNEVALFLKALRDLDRESSGDLFLLFANDFRAPDTFVNTIAQTVQQESQLTNEAAGPAVAKLPPLPADFLASA